jgi:hypothetical protein
VHGDVQIKRKKERGGEKTKAQSGLHTPVRSMAVSLLQLKKLPVGRRRARSTAPTRQKHFANLFLRQNKPDAVAEQDSQNSVRVLLCAVSGTP